MSRTRWTLAAIIIEQTGNGKGFNYAITDALDQRIVQLELKFHS